MTFEERKITKDVGDRLDVKFSEIMGRCRRDDIVRARWFVWYALILRGYSYTNVAKTFGVHHTAVSHAVQSLRMRIAINDRPTMKAVARLIHILDTARQRFRYAITVSGNVIVTSSIELEPATLRERALAEVETGACDFTTQTIERKEIAVAA